MLQESILTYSRATHADYHETCCRAPRRRPRHRDHAESPATLFETGVRALPQVLAQTSLAVLLLRSSIALARPIMSNDWSAGQEA